MTVEVIELYDDQTYRLTAKTATRIRRFHVKGCEEPEDAASAEGIPSILSKYKSTDMLAKSIECEPDGRDDLHLVTVTYEYSEDEPETSDIGDETWSLDLAGKTINKQVAYNQDGYGATRRDVGKLIGVSSDGSVAGVDVYVPGGTMTISKTLARTSVKQANVVTWERMSGHYNAAPFCGFAIGEVLFVGPRIAKVGKDKVTVEFNFEINPNETASELPEFTDATGTAFTITGGKLGWEYLWCEQARREVDSRPGFAVQGAYVAKVYKEADFATLPLTGSLDLAEEET